ncbi:MAG: 3-isopropylmalate dehydrogenase [Candidatus Eremiobacteraeota bacterium]|nr:3-isopropylmalate dehydrogenase [Candidatus Eremiobacteraeota bacterium]
MPTIAILPGDGIGVEVTTVAERVLGRVRPDCVFDRGLVGAAALDVEGTPFPAATRDLCERSAAILFGAVGDPRYDGAAAERRPEFAILQLRKHFDLFANLRPVAMLPGLEDASSLRPEFVRALDLVVVRETTSGLYFGEPKYTRSIDGVETAVDTLVYRAPEIERIARVAFELARTRRRRVTSVDKQNVLESGRLWRRVVTALHAAEFADVELEHLLVDNAAMQLVRDPQRFDVVLTENTFGDILSDEAGMLTGSLGNLPSATLGTRANRDGRFGLYEPISGSAPDIAGLGVANPIAAILSAALLCRYSLGDEANAARIEGAVARAIADGARTRDIARGAQAALGTDAFGQCVLAALESVAV